MRYLRPTELKALLTACHEWLRPIVALAFCTGMRRGEILGLRWLDLDLPNKRLLLPQTKNGEGRIVYLNQLAMQVIASLPSTAERKPTDRLFAGIVPEYVSLAFRRVCKDLE